MLKLVLQLGSSSDDMTSLELRGDQKKLDVIRALSRVDGVVD
jgi:hypothetical protein